MFKGGQTILFSSSKIKTANPIQALQCEYTQRIEKKLQKTTTEKLLITSIGLFIGQKNRKNGDYSNIYDL